MNTILFLILFPILFSFLLLLFRGEGMRRILVGLATLAIIVGSLMLFRMDVWNGGNGVFFNIPTHTGDMIILAADVLLFIYVSYISFKHKRPLIGLLMLAQFVPMMYFEFAEGHNLTITNALYVDNFSIIMGLIIGIVGGLIAIFALPYMEDFHHHLPKLKDKRPFFFFVVFLFLGAMFGVVFSNDLLWMYFFWEVTTLCSFWLIGYKEDDVSTNNALKAITYNMIGGVGFVAGILICYYQTGTVEMDKMIAAPKAIAILPAALLAFAGMTKSAQMPFTSWLLGAMVAPTPVSALLHSSTMVKAGVFLVVKMAPIFHGSLTGEFVALVGAVTFLGTSLMAISQPDAKRVLALSTVANLGLVILCAGIGTPEAVWAAILLIIFHAIAKALLFLCVGSTEHKIGSRNIETMDDLLRRVPALAIMMLIGMSAMFLAPFGMLIAKWVVLKALVDAHSLSLLLLVFGSAATLFFWVKWMGKLVSLSFIKKDDHPHMAALELYPLVILAIGSVATCVLFPVVSSLMINDYVLHALGGTVTIDESNVTIMLVMLCLLLIIPVTSYLSQKESSADGRRQVPIYLGGANTGHENTKMTGSMQVEYVVEGKNYYLTEYFGEKVLFNKTACLVIGIIVIMFIVAGGMSR
jgi:ech hydrogenase subunit A